MVEFKKCRKNRYNVKLVRGCALLIMFAILIMLEPFLVQKVLAIHSISITTDKSSYIYGDTIVVSGSVNTGTQENFLTVKILDPYSNLVQTTQTAVNTNGSYKDEVKITGTNWKTSGSYTILVQYGSEYQAQTTFTFTATTTPINDTFQVRVPNTIQIFNIPYTINGGVVEGISADPYNPSLTVSILSVNYGSITLSLPRNLLDAKTSNGTDSPLIILVDGTGIRPQKEHDSPNNRTLTIQFLQGDKDIEIIGTSMGSQNNSTLNSSANSANQHPVIQIANTSKLSSPVPEFPSGTMIFLIAFIMIAVIARTIPEKMNGTLSNS